MLLSTAAFAACLATTQAFQNTSPFLLFSSSSSPKSLQNISRDQLQFARSVEKTAKSFLNDCPSEIYYIITQPAVSTRDWNTEDHVPFLKRALSDSGVRTLFSVSEVVGQELAAAEEYAAYIKSHCGGVELDEEQTAMFDPRNPPAKTVIVRTAFDELWLGLGQRNEELANNDAKLYNSLLKELPTGPKYTVIYTTTPLTEAIREEYQYESVFDVGVHLDLKRDLRIRAPAHTIERDTRPLFEKYQFLTPGIFMGLLVGTILLAILSVGIRAVSSLQVSYAAFEKDMGPAAQKKQQ